MSTNPTNNHSDIQALIARMTSHERRVLMDLYDQCLRSRKGVGGVPVVERATVRYLIETGYVEVQELLDGIPSSAVFWLTEIGIALAREIHRQDST